MLAALALLASAQATDVLFLEATPVSVDDFSVAGVFTSMVTSAAEARGLDFEDGDAVRAWAGADADACWDVDACPANLWSRTGARLAVVLSVGRTDEGLAIGVRLHGVDEAAPFKTFDALAAPGEEAAVADRIARAAAEALPLLSARAPMGGPVLVLEDELILAPDEADPDEPAADAGDPLPELPDLDGERRPRDASAAARRDARGERPDRDPRVLDQLRTDEERRAMGVPATAYARYRESGLSRGAWLAKARVRAGRAFLELGGGWGLGDVDRAYGVRLRIEEDDGVFDTVGTRSVEGARGGEAPNFGVTLGYAPAWYLDTSVTLAFQYGRKYLDTGWECPDRCETAEAEDTYDVGAVQGVIEPRLRLYPVATGVVKPYALVAFTVLLHDAFEVPDTTFVDYPDSPAGASFGPTGGLGLAIDVASRVSLFGEVPATLLLSQPETRADGEVDLAPNPSQDTGYLVRFGGGIVVRL